MAAGGALWSLVRRLRMTTAMSLPGWGPQAVMVRLPVLASLARPCRLQDQRSGEDRVELWGTGLQRELRRRVRGRACLARGSFSGPTDLIRRRLEMGACETRGRQTPDSPKSDASLRSAPNWLPLHRRSASGDGLLRSNLA
jgi:hypothetical protein